MRVDVYSGDTQALYPGNGSYEEALRQEAMDKSTTICFAIGGGKGKLCVDKSRHCPPPLLYSICSIVLEIFYVIMMGLSTH